MPTPTSTDEEREGLTGTDWISVICPNTFLDSCCRANGGKVMTVPMRRPSDDPRMGPVRITVLCGGSGAPGVQRRTWYVLGKYLISDGWFQNWEPTVMHEMFDPNTAVTQDLYTRTIVGLTYYFENFPPKIQSKIQFNYEFRHHQGNGPGRSL